MKKIVWAVDAFENPEYLRKLAVPALKALARQPSWGSVEVIPIYILSPGEINLSLEFSGPWIEQYRHAAERALRHALKGLNVPGLGSPQVITENFTSTSQAARTLASHAFAEDADMIVVTTHARKGIGRLFMGSFAEALLFHSKVPVLMLKPNIEIPSRIKTILVPTQFGPKSKMVFRKIVEEAKSLDARIILFHTIPHPIEPILQSGAYIAGGSWVPVQAYFSEETDRHRRRADAWARWAEHHGVPVEVVIDIQGGDIGDSVVYLAKSRHVDLIAMESRTGPVASTILGSITRHVIRNAGAPVWVFRPTHIASARETYRRAA